MTSGDGFDLRALVRDVLDQADDLDLDKLVNEVDRRIEVGDRDAALRQSLPAVVRDVVRNGRSHLSIVADTGAQERTRPAADRPSRKVAGIRDYWRRALTAEFSVDNAGGIKRLAELTRADLVFNIESREKIARTNAAKAMELRGLLDLVTRHDVETVGELPESVLASTLVRAA